MNETFFKRIIIDEAAAPRNFHPGECQPVGTWRRASRVTPVHPVSSGSGVAEVTVATANPQRRGRAVSGTTVAVVMSRENANAGHPNVDE